MYLIKNKVLTVITAARYHLLSGALSILPRWGPSQGKDLFTSVAATVQTSSAAEIVRRLPSPTSDGKYSINFYSG